VTGWSDGLEVSAPWQGAVAAEAYQLWPVKQALDMPRVALLLADDVGLGKTIQAGLVLTELMARRRIRRTLVVCPASLQLQWRDEMRDKSSLDFTVVDRAAISDIQREYGMDTNPWTVTPQRSHQWISCASPTC
jgi:SNF2 family DNA or RNA helicase